MITYLVTQRHAYAIENFLAACGEALAERFRVETYVSMFGDLDKFEARPGTYIFSDVERLSGPVPYRCAEAWKRISDLGESTRLLNHPTRSMRRYELLRTLFESGRNAFNAYRMVECRQPQRWPVFIREENEHTKNLTKLLHTPEELDAAVADIFEKGHSREDKLIVEFCDTRDDQGLFYVYSAYLVGERLIPRGLNASRIWVLGHRQQEYVKTPEVLEKRRRYMETNPHERELREIFRLARIDYGKIDYAILDDRLQVWEINTNPVVLTVQERKTLLSEDPEDAESKANIGQRLEGFIAAFAEIDVQNAPDGTGDL